MNLSHVILSPSCAVQDQEKYVMKYFLLSGLDLQNVPFQSGNTIILNNYFSFVIVKIFLEVANAYTRPVEYKHSWFIQRH